MATEILVTVKTNGQIVFGDHAGDFAPATANVLAIGTPTEVQLAMAGVAAGEARQSAKVTLPDPRPAHYSFIASPEMATSVVAGETIALYWAPSTNSIAANGNPGGVSGSDADYTGTAASTMEESLKQLQYIGVFVLTDDATGTVQIAVCIGGEEFRPRERYGSLIVVNRSTVAAHSDDVEWGIYMDPHDVPEFQA